MYRPLRVFMTIGASLAAIGCLLGLRFLYFYLSEQGAAGHMQSLILTAILIILGFQVCLIGLIAELVRMNRKMLEETLHRVRRLELVQMASREQEKPVHEHE